MRFNNLADWLDWQASSHPRKIDLGLDRVRTVYQALNPSPPPFTITVAGTNGKGSCIALLEAILRAEGYQVGSYTSPHLLRYNERIRINGKNAEDAMICEVFDRIDQAKKEISLSFFEFGTLTALDLFATAQVDVQLLEVGLGGRLDAVNILDADAALITSIAIDHSDWLGESRDAIGLEKAGVLRKNRPAVIGDPSPPESILKYANEQHIQLSCLGKDFHYKKQADNGWCWSNYDFSYENLPLPTLQGEHQLQNSSAVLQILHLIKAQLPVLETSIHQGLKSACLPGRFQHIPGKPEVLLDVAHNPQSAVALAHYLQQVFPNRRILSVFTMMKDKDIESVLFAMKSVIDHWYVPSLAIDRCADKPQLEQAFQNCSIHTVKSFTHFSAALTAARQDANDDDLIIIFGSFFLVAQYYIDSGLSVETLYH